MVSIRSNHKFPVNFSNLKEWLTNSNNRDLTTALEPVIDDYIEIVKNHQEEYDNLDIDLAVLSVELVEILQGLGVDNFTLVASFLFPLVDHGLIPIEDLVKYGDKVTKMIKGTIAMAQIENLRQSDEFSSQQQQNIRHMLLSIVDDYRSMIVKIAERIAYLRQLSKLNDDEAERIAQQGFKIYIPLANRLGIGNLKWEFEDLCFKILNPSEYHEIKSKLNGKRTQREMYLSSFVNELKSKLTNFINGKFEVYGRPKHIYSIYAKMLKKKLRFEELYDILAVRVLVEDVQQSYGVLGFLHTTYRHIPKEFTDYIANPKKNGYQSIHTIIKDHNSKIVEIQIRSYQMHNDAEMGVAAHWNYKEGGKSSREDKVAWLRELLNSDQDYNEKINEIRDQLFNDRVYIFTPRGDVVDLPVGSTPLDFAYAIHSQIGNCCIGAKVNNRMVNFLYELVTGDQVEIITNKKSTPSRDWLANGYVTSSRARSKIQAFFSSRDKEKNVAFGKSILDNKLKAEGIKQTPEIEQELCKKYKVNKVEDLYIGLTTSKIKHQSLELHLRSLIEDKETSSASIADKQIMSRMSEHSTPSKRQRDNGIRISGEADLLYNLSKCCKPIPGDSIHGYITKGRGVSIHRSDCIHLNKLAQLHEERLIDVSWSDSSFKHNKVISNFKLTAYNRDGILRDVAQCASQEKANIISINSRANPKTMMIVYMMEIEFYSIDTLHTAITKLQNIKDVVEVIRL